MVDHRDPEDPPADRSLRVTSRSCPLGGIAARMVVEQEDRRRAFPDRRGEHLSRVDEAAVEDPRRHPLLPQWAVLHVEEHGDEYLHGESESRNRYRSKTSAAERNGSGRRRGTRAPCARAREPPPTETPPLVRRFASPCGAAHPFPVVGNALRNSSVSSTPSKAARRGR